MSLWGVGVGGFSFKVPQGTLGHGSSPAGTLVLTLSQVAAMIEF